MDTDEMTPTELETRKLYIALVKAIGAGFHPDTYGHQYASLPDEYDADAVDMIVDATFQIFAVDPYELALEVLNGNVV